MCRCQRGLGWPERLSMRQDWSWEPSLSLAGSHTTMDNPVSLNEHFRDMVLITINGAPDIETMKRLWAIEVRHFDAEQKFASISDLTCGKIPDKEYREAQQQHIQTYMQDIKQFHICAAIIATNPVFRMVLNMIFSISPLPNPHRICSSIEDATDWVFTEMHKHGLGTPDRAECIQALYDARVE